jgi:heptosyltransferase-2
MKYFVIRFSSLGDCILLCPLLHHLKTEGAKEITVLTKESYQEIFLACKAVDRIISLGSKPTLLQLYRIAASYRRDDYQFIDAHNTLRSRAFTALLPALPPRLKKYTADRLALIHLKRRHSLPHMVVRYSYLGESLGFPPAVYTSDVLKIPERFVDNVAKRIPSGDGRLIAIAPGSRWPMKRWSEDRYLDLCRRIIEKHSCKVVLLGDANDAPTTSRIHDALGEDVIDQAGSIGLMQTAAWIRCSKAFVGNDSGLMHLAEAVGVPVLALFGPTVEQFGYYPSLPGSKVCERDLECRPCSRNGSLLCPKGTQECLTGIGVEDIEDAFSDLLKGVGPGKYIIA